MVRIVERCRGGGVARRRSALVAAVTEVCVMISEHLNASGGR
jgi:hypothetical protein